MSTLGGKSVYEALKERILDGSIEAGAHLREVWLAEMFSVSRTPVREALLRLEHEGLLERSGRSLYVRVVDSERIIQVYDLRIILEGRAAAQAASRRTEPDMERLESLVSHDETLEVPSEPVRVANNLKFHAALAAAAHDPALGDLLDRLSTHLVHAPHSTLSFPGRWETALSEHRSLVDAIKAKDAPTARDIAELHMMKARQLRLKLLGFEASSD